MVRKFVVGITTLLIIGVFAGSAFATSYHLDWTGQGSENLPCLMDSGTGGGHWVLTGKGITSAVANVDGEQIVMTQNGSGSWYADSTNDVTDGTVAFVDFERNAGATGNPQFVLSHCNGLSDGYGY